jgi:hypothetical protein
MRGEHPSAVLSSPCTPCLLPPLISSLLAPPPAYPPSQVLERELGEGDYIDALCLLTIRSLYALYCLLTICSLYALYCLLTIRSLYALYCLLTIHSTSRY